MVTVTSILDSTASMVEEMPSYAATQRMREHNLRAFARCYDNCRDECQQEIDGIMSIQDQWDCAQKLLQTTASIPITTSLVDANSSISTSDLGGARMSPEISKSDPGTILITATSHAVTVFADDAHRSGTSSPLLRQPGALAGLFLGCTAGMALLIFGVIILVLKRRARRRLEALGAGSNASGEVIMLEVGAGGQISRKGTSCGGDALGDFKSFGRNGFGDGRDGVEMVGHADEDVTEYDNTRENVYR
ncbi:hypothetical protein FKW77_001646 [Venturia effusa]|uniref:Uncharacterized protein n=1 Tax=Venturia effusa TaxID=50376 RepID=A0A517LNF0_9PEZI|nr:hypothetical protein FKW77_001646 [Venturia effusa]